MSEVISEEVA